MNVFHNALEHPQQWVLEMMAELRTHDERDALQALRAGLQALRDRLTLEEVAQLSAQMPLVIRGLFFEGWDPTGKPLRLRKREEFLSLVRERYAPRHQATADEIVRALFRVLGRHVSQGELTDVMATLPQEIVEIVSGGPRDTEI
jgi:uncharacterized protein (DUF2267 family)